MKTIPQSFLTFVLIVVLFDANRSITEAQEYFTYSDKATSEVLEYTGLSAAGTLVRHRRAVDGNGTAANSTAADSGVEMTTIPTAAPTDAPSNSTDDVVSGIDGNTNGSEPTPAPEDVTSPTASTTTAPFNTTTIRDTHTYYKSHIYNEPSVTAPYLEMFKKTFFGVAPSHNFLKNGFGRVKLFKSSFNFLFYGHSMNTIAPTTGGFAYMSDFLHPYLTHSQYIAPLMSQFHTVNNKSDVYHVDDGSTFWILWKDMYLKDKDSAGPFTFYMAIHKNGTIVFVYEKIPIALTEITSTRKIGLSDAFYQDVMFAFSIRLRRIYRYHLLQIRPDKVRDGTVVVLEALPTCHQMSTCKECLAGKTNFTCRWCPAVGRCSSGVDRKRQEWFEKSCHLLTASSDNCNPISTPAPNGVGRVSRHKSTKGLSVSATVGVVLLILTAVIVTAGVVVWCRYAYSHPASPSGIWLMEHRPSVIKEKMTSMFRNSNSPGERYHVSFNSHESVA